MPDIGQVARPAPSWRNIGRWLREAGQTYGAIATLLILVVYNTLFTENFLTQQTFRVNLTQISTIVIVGVGMTLVIATGGIDLSVGSLMAISGVIAPMFFMNISGISGVILAVIVPILVAGLFGLFNGVLVTYGRIQPFIATLVLFIAGRGIAQALVKGNLVTFSHPGFKFIGQGQIFGIRFQIILMVAIVAIVAWVIRATLVGRYILAVGGNEPAARLTGIPIRTVKLAVYGVSGLLAGLAGLIVIAINSSADASQIGMNMELDAIAAVAVGGTALTGGRATVIGTLIGALIIQLIRYTLLSHGIPDTAALVIKAAIIVLAVIVQRQPQS